MCAKYGFEKPNDRRALDLMNAAAKAVVTDLPESIIAYGVSDEYRYGSSTSRFLGTTVHQVIEPALSFTSHVLCLNDEQGERYMASSLYELPRVDKSAANSSVQSFLPLPPITSTYGQHTFPTRHSPPLCQHLMVVQYAIQAFKTSETI